MLVDWPWAARGAGWFDALTLLVNVRYYDPRADVEAMIATHGVFDGMPAEAATHVLAAFAGMFLEASLDWSQKESANIVKNIVDNARNGDIILMHSSSAQSVDLEALPTVIEELQEKGFELVDVATMLGIPGYQ